MFRIAFVLMTTIFCALASAEKVAEIQTRGIVIHYEFASSTKQIVDRLKDLPVGTQLLLEGGEFVVVAPLWGSNSSSTTIASQVATVPVTTGQSNALSFRNEATATYTDHQADQSAKDWYRLEEDSRITDARIRQMDVDSSNRLRQQELREEESRRRAWEQSARRREDVRRTREAEELRERQQAQRERQQAVNNARTVTREVVTIIERAKSAQK